MNLIFHILRKDFHHVRLILCVWYLLLTLAAALQAKSDLLLGEDAELSKVPVQDKEVVMAVFFLAVLAAVLELSLRATVVSKLIHDDSVVGSTAFWLSRPVSGSKLLASKALFLALTLVLPAMLVRLLVFSQFVGANSTSRHDLLAEVVSAAVLMTLAVLTPSLARMAFLGGIMAGVTCSGLLFLSWLAIPAVDGQELGRLFTDELPWLLVLAVCGVAICNQYLTRRTARSTIMAFTGIPLFLLLMSRHWFQGAI